VRLAVTTAILSPSLLQARCVNSWENASTAGHHSEIFVRENTAEDNLGVTGSLQWCYAHTNSPIIASLHSDVEIFEKGWDARVLSEFNDPQVGIVGFGGALQHAEEDIYKIPYSLNQLRRIGYMSNTNDAETHGLRFEGACDVAVLDGFCLVIRRELLTRCGGWPVESLPFHCYDYWACIAAHKLGYKVRLVGVKCQHHGGTTSTTPAYQEWSQRVLGKTDQQVHEESHRWIYEYGRGVLPWCCPAPEAKR
jgi:Glycosyltransferase like family